MTNDIRFRASVQDENQYLILSIIVKASPGYDKTGIQFRWQLTVSEPASNGWYGGECEIKAQSKHRLDDCVKMARRVIGRPEYDYNAFEPADIITRLRKIKAVEETYDNREGENVPLAEIKGPEYQRWQDDNKVYGEEWCFTSLLARSEYEAQELIATAFNEYRNSPDTEARFAAWILAGRPVKQKDRSALWSDDEVDTRTVEQKIADAEAKCVPEPELEGKEG